MDVLFMLLCVMCYVGCVVVCYPSRKPNSVPITAAAFACFGSFFHFSCVEDAISLTF